MILDFEKIDKLRNEYTGQLVTIDAKVPELARFAGRRGVVQTVNHMGLALVQFEGEDRTRYDIELDYLRVVDLPANSSSSSEAELPADTSPREELSRLEKARLAKERDEVSGASA